MFHRWWWTQGGQCRWWGRSYSRWHLGWGNSPSAGTAISSLCRCKNSDLSLKSHKIYMKIIDNPLFTFFNLLRGAVGDVSSHTEAVRRLKNSLCGKSRSGVWQSSDWPPTRPTLTSQYNSSIPPAEYWQARNKSQSPSQVSWTHPLPTELFFNSFCLF